MKNGETSKLDAYENYALQGEVYNKVIRKDFLIKNHLLFEEGIIYEDTLWISQLKCYLPKILYIPSVLYIYCLRGGSVMTTYTFHHLGSRIKIALKSYQFASKQKNKVAYYAWNTAYSFRKSALLYMATTTSNSFSNYVKLYRFFKAHIPLTTEIETLLLPRFSIIKKMRFRFNRLPVMIGSLLEYICIMATYRELTRKKLIDKNYIDINLSDAFFEIYT